MGERPLERLRSSCRQRHVRVGEHSEELAKPLRVQVDAYRLGSKCSCDHIAGADSTQCERPGKQRTAALEVGEGWEVGRVFGTDKSEPQ